MYSYGGPAAPRRLTMWERQALRMFLFPATLVALADTVSDFCCFSVIAENYSSLDTPGIQIACWVFSCLGLTLVITELMLKLLSESHWLLYVGHLVGLARIFLQDVPMIVIAALAVRKLAAPGLAIFSLAASAVSILMTIFMLLWYYVNFSRTYDPRLP
eukprot:RCo051395